MKRSLTVSVTTAALVVPGAGPTNTYAPGSRWQSLSHNAYPDHGKYTDAENQGGQELHFGAKEKVTLRWQSAARAHANFISTDQVEDVAKVMKGTR